jgi:hypothetical protein
LEGLSVGRKRPRCWGQVRVSDPTEARAVHNTVEQFIWNGIVSSEHESAELDSDRG